VSRVNVNEVCCSDFRSNSSESPDVSDIQFVHTLSGSLREKAQLTVLRVKSLMGLIEGRTPKFLGTFYLF